LKITREIKTAILVIGSILLFIWGYSFLKGKDLFEDYTTLYVEYDNVEGVGKSAAVTLNGLTIGKVNDIQFSNDTGKLLVELQIKSNFPISQSSTATIYDPGLIGGKQIMIVPNLNDKKMAMSGSKLIGNTKPGLTDLVGEKLAPLQMKLDKVLLNADQLISGINNVLDKKGQEDLKKALAELTETLVQFHKASESVNGMIADNKNHINGVVSDFHKVSTNFSKISDSLSKADLGKTAKSLQITLEKVDLMLADMNAGKGTVGKMMKDEALYNNLSQTSKELELLLQDVRLNPTRYVNVSLFGKKNKPYTAPSEKSPK
jgi:phospholipid/cholesterol/gamma-HCH transport system substrate-binding protein